MKKLITWMVALSGIVAMSGCVIEEDFPEMLPKLQEGTDIPKSKHDTKGPYWDSFTFRSLTGKEDLVVTRKQDEKEPLSISTSNYDQRFLAVAVYSTDCEACKLAASYFDKLAGTITSSYGIDYVIIFADIFEDSENKNVEWIQNLSHVDAYTNVAMACVDGACNKVFAPELRGLDRGTIYYVDKSDITKTLRGTTWNTTDDPESLYQAMQTQLAKWLGLKPITFDAGVEDWSSSQVDIQ